MKKWYQVQAKGNKKAEISILDQIGKDFWGDGSTVSAKQFIKDVKALGDIDTIDLFLNSPGGSVFEGNVIYNYLKAHSATINVKIMGIAASIASVVAMAGDRVEMPENAMMMIHDPSGMVMGTAKDMRKIAEALDKIGTGIVAAYHNKSGQDEVEIADMMDEETWFTAKEAVELGLADAVTEEVKIEANLESLSGFKNVPKSFINQCAGISGETNKDKGEQKMDITIEMLKAEHPDIVAAIQAEVKTDENVRAEGVKEGATNELARIMDVQAQSMPGHESLVASLMFDGKTTGPEAAVKILNAEKAARKAALDANAADAPDGLDDASTDDLDADGVADDATIDEKCKAKWDKDKALRAEYGDDFESCLAFEKADAKGQVRTLNK